MTFGTAWDTRTNSETQGDNDEPTDRNDKENAGVDARGCGRTGGPAGIRFRTDTAEATGSSTGTTGACPGTRTFRSAVACVGTDADARADAIAPGYGGVRSAAPAEP